MISKLNLYSICLLAVQYYLEIYEDVIFLSVSSSYFIRITTIQTEKSTLSTHTLSTDPPITVLTSDRIVHIPCPHTFIDATFITLKLRVYIIRIRAV